MVRIGCGHLFAIGFDPNRYWSSRPSRENCQNLPCRTVVLPYQFYRIDPLSESMVQIGKIAFLYGSPGSFWGMYQVSTHHEESQFGSYRGKSCHLGKVSVDFLL